jgi:SAM-dependent methyltransferase
MSGTNGDGWLNEYLAWLEQEPPAPHPDILMSRYLDHLLATGAPVRRIATAMDTIVKRLDGETDAWRRIFNNVYRSPAPGYSTHANPHLARLVDDMRPGAALDINMGQGRNTIFLAANGWTVTGFDVAEDGLAAARGHAAAAGVQIHTIWSTAQTFSYRDAVWDLIVALYCPLPLDDSTFPVKITRALRPGGILFIESFAGDSRIGPRRMPTEVDAEDLRRAFADLDILHQEESFGASDWSESESSLVRFVAQRPSLERRP